jgi:undecaprenyl pyrophosphate synthase
MAAYGKRWEGRAVEAVIEHYDSGDETVSLVTENYLKKKLPREHIQGKKPGSPIQLPAAGRQTISRRDQK